MWDSRGKGEEKEEEIVKDANKKREQILKDAEDLALESKRKALEESKAEIARMAILGAEKILKGKVQ